MNQFTTLVFSALIAFLTIGCEKAPLPESEEIPVAKPPEPVIVLPPELTVTAPPVPTARPAEPAEPLDIKIAGGKEAWNSQVADVQAVLDSVAAEMMRSFPDRRLESITVHAKGGPITLYKRDSRGGYTVRLDTGDRLWAQASFQFAHELCHILANYREDVNPNGWFEESLCEAASLYVLRAMGKTWQTDPPYSNWQSYNESLTGYAQKRIDDAQLLGQQSLSDWYEEREQQLRKSETQRELNNVAAVKLLPLLEENPASWEAIGWLNVEPSFADDEFTEYLKRWYHYVPERHREFVEDVANEFGIEIESR